MPLDFHIEDANGHSLIKLNDEKLLFVSALKLGWNQPHHFHVLKYIDPYDDTTFNGAMIKDFIKDLEYLEQSMVFSEEEKAFTRELIKMSSQALAEPHLYLKIYGD